MTRPFTSALGTREAFAVAHAGSSRSGRSWGQRSSRWASYDLAMGRVARDAEAQRAHGVVGLAVERSQKKRDTDAGAGQHHDLEVTIHTLGTAIVTLGHDPPAPPSLSTILPLS